MKTFLLPCLATACLTALAHAAPADDVKAAAKKLADAPSYAWSSTTEIANSQFNAGPAEGVTEKGGYTVITRSFNGNTMQTIRKGDQFVMQNQEGTWMTRDEMMQQFAGGGGAAPAGGRAGRGGGGMLGGNQNNPAEEISALATQATNLKSVDGALVGELSETAVTQRLSFGGRGGQGGQTPPAPKNASGSVKFWLKEGAVTKYQLHVKGTVAGRDGDQERDVTTTVEIKNVGATKVEIPEAAKKKIGA